jgi:peptide/nickel transport system permease protein
MADSLPTGAIVEAAKKNSSFLTFFKRLAREKPLGLAGGIVTLLLLLTGIFADFLAPYGMNDTYAGERLLPPSAEFLLGTDNVGRDILSRIIYGARISVIIGLTASTLATFLSAAIGGVSGYFGGKFDLLVQRGVDLWMCVPSLIILMILVTMLGASLWSIILALALTWGITGSRIVRGAIIGIKENVYVAAGISIGCSTTRILLRHILPNTLPTLIVLFSLRIPGIILAESTLSFLGYGIPPPTPSWGGMLSGSGRSYMYQAPWMAIWPGLALAITVFAINMLGDAVRDLIDPRLRGGAGRFGVKGHIKGGRLV